MMDKIEQDLLNKLPETIANNTKKQINECLKEIEIMNKEYLKEIKIINKELINEYRIILEERLKEMTEEIIKHYSKNFENINNRLDETIKEMKNNTKILQLETLTDELIMISKNDQHNSVSNKSIRDIKKELKELIFR